MRFQPALGTTTTAQCGDVSTANRLLPPELEDEEIKEEEDSPASVRAVDDEDEVADEDAGEWLLLFDDACRSNPGPGSSSTACSSLASP